ncbi:DUF5694 domain-containing protein [Sphingomonas sp. 1P06PA]|uniref:DUF5694 domain-containing protein n=1 Tax=Sphingomonas sp. 1P06PA TaxID=554121 RepID=UPI0039A4FFC4
MKIVGIMLGLALGAVATAAAAVPYKPAYDPKLAPGRVAGGKTPLLVLGTAHLSEFKQIRPDWLEPLLTRLAAFKPAVITIEGLSGQDCDRLRRYSALYPEVADDYCADPTPAQKSLGLDGPGAEAEIARLLAAWPAAPTPAERRRLAALFVASGDRASALVQWLRLPPADRIAADGLDAASRTVLDERIASKPNENYWIAATLAARLGLERVYPTDDHSADGIVATLPAAYGEAIQKAWSAPNPYLDRYRARTAKLAGPADMLDLYRFLNRPENQLAAVSGDFNANMAAQSDKLWGRRYYAWWQARNLRMVANIVAASGTDPGARVLSIVGVSHKPYFELYLDRVEDIELVDAATILK